MIPKTNKITLATSALPLYCKLISVIPKAKNKTPKIRLTTLFDFVPIVANNKIALITKIKPKPINTTPIINGKALIKTVGSTNNQIDIVNKKIPLIKSPSNKDKLNINADVINKIALSNKYVNEAEDGHINTDCKDMEYNSQVISKIE